MRKPELLIFDWDGTLLDSTASLVECMREAARTAGAEPPEVERIRSVIGHQPHHTLQHLFPHAEDDERRRLRETFRDLWLSRFRHHAELLPGVQSALTELRQAEFMLAIATGKSRAGLNWDLGQTDLADAFVITRTADETHPKPNPTMVLEILDELGARPDNALVVGDTVSDLEMARQAGCASVAVLSGAHGREELLSGHPLACLSDVRELPGWLARSS